TFGPCRSAMIAIGRSSSSETSRTRRIRSAWSSCVPCEKLRRAASIPARASSSTRSRDDDAGPSVATIFVRRGSSADIGSDYPATRADFAPMLRQAWERHAEDWIRWAREPGHDSYWLFHRDRFLELVPPPGNLTLDLGCGEGRLSRDLAARGHRILGIDP